MLDCRKYAIFSVVFVFVISTYIYSAMKVDRFRSRFDSTQQISALMVSPEILEVASGEFKFLLADYLLLKASVFLGGTYGTNPSDRQAIATLMKQSLYLDPYFFQTCYYVQSFLAWKRPMVKEAVELLKISKQYRTWDWQPDFYIGFDYYYFLKDNLNGSKYLMEASEKSGASPLLALLGARLAQKGGATQAGILFLVNMYETTDDKDARKQIEMRIEALKGVLVLEKAIETFTAKFNRKPDTLDELTTEGILEALPINPYLKGYQYKDGQVEF